MSRFQVGDKVVYHVVCDELDDEGYIGADGHVGTVVAVKNRGKFIYDVKFDTYETRFIYICSEKELFPEKFDKSVEEFL